MGTKLPVIGLGAGGHAKVLIEALRNNPTYEPIGMLDTNPQLHGQKILDVPVLGGDNLLLELVQKGVVHCFIGVGSVGSTRVRQCLFDSARKFGLEPINIIHATANISPSAKLGLGVTILAGSIISTEACLEDNVVVNTGAIVEHDCRIGAHCHIATGARLAGMVTVGAGTHIGIGATVRQSIRIGQNVVVGAGAVVVDDVPEGVVVVGVPAKEIRSNQPGR